MALSKSDLKTKILSELSGQGFDVSANGRDAGGWIVKFAQAVANAVIDEIVQNAELVPVSTDSGAAGSGIVEGKVK